MSEPHQAEPKHPDPAPWAGAGFFKAVRSNDGLELIAKHPPSFILLYVIAFRANRNAGYNRHGLGPGEAFVGDFESFGLTEQSYRTAKRILSEGGLATFQPTNRGTIAKLTTTRVFDINIDVGNDLRNDQLTDSQRTGNGQLTTNKEVKKLRREEYKKGTYLSQKHFQGNKPPQPNRNTGTLNESSTNDYSRASKVVQPPNV